MQVAAADSHPGVLGRVEHAAAHVLCDAEHGQVVSVRTAELVDCGPGLLPASQCAGGASRGPLAGAAVGPCVAAAQLPIGQLCHSSNPRRDLKSRSLPISI